MRALALVLVPVAACRAAPSADIPTLSNVEHVSSCIVSGRLTTVETGAPIASATVVLDGSPKQSEVGLSDWDGRFSIVSIGTQTALTLYYANQTSKRSLTDGGCGRSFRAKIATQYPRPIIMWIIGRDGT